MSISSSISTKWDHFADSNGVIKFIDVTLRGCAQVMFQNNPLTGLIFFIAIFIAAYGEGNPAAAYGCVLGTLIATFTGRFLRDRTSWLAGLYGYNGCLVGVALPTFLAVTPLLWCCIVIGSIVSVPELPLPLMDVSAQSFFNDRIFENLFKGISEVYLLSSVTAGVLFVVGLAVASRWAAIFAIGGSFLAIITAALLGAKANSIESGLYAFSAVLTAIALGSTFNKPSWRVLGYTLIGVVFTVFVQGAMNTLLTPVGIPTLTMPFVLASWLFLVPNQDIMPPHRQGQ